MAKPQSTTTTSNASTYLDRVGPALAQLDQAHENLTRALDEVRSGAMPAEQALGQARAERAQLLRALEAVRSLQAPPEAEAAHPHLLRALEGSIQAIDAAIECLGGDILASLQACQRVEPLAQRADAELEAFNRLVPQE